MITAMSGTERKIAEKFLSKDGLSRFTAADFGCVCGVKRRAERERFLVDVEITVMVGDAGVGLVGGCRAEIGISALHMQQVLGEVVAAERKRAVRRCRDTERGRGPCGLLAGKRVVQKRRGKVVPFDLCRAAASMDARTCARVSGRSVRVVPSSSAYSATAL